MEFCGTNSSSNLCMLMHSVLMLLYNVLLLQINTVILVIVLVQIARSVHAKKHRNTVTKGTNNEPQRKNFSDALYVSLFC